MIGADRPGVRIHWLLLVLAIMILLTAGWPLLNLAAADRHRVSAGTTISVGTSAAASARITIGPGWSVLPAESDPRQGYSLERGAVTVRISYVNLVENAQRSRLWAGLRQLLRLDDAGLRLGRPVPTTTAQGLRGVTGSLSDKNLAGAAVIFPGPSGRFAIEMVVLGPRHAHLGVAAAERMSKSLRFGAAPR
jgi:hypothetical protein